MNKQQRDYWYPKIVFVKFGEFCSGCGVKPFPSYARVLPEIPILISKLKMHYWINGTKSRKLCTILYIDHIDNDDSNNSLDNFQLLCPSCNVVKNPKKPQLFSSREKTPEMLRGDVQELAFRNYVHNEILENDWVPRDDLINGGAEYLTDFDEGKTLSPETCKRYMNKMLSPIGLYVERKSYITFKYKLPLLDQWIYDQESKKEETIESRRKLTDSYE